MNVKELRIGNTIGFENEPFTVTIPLLSEIEKDPKLFNPITLTEERLLKFGFEKGEYIKRFYGLEYFKNGISIFIENGEFRFYTHLNRAWTSYEYVHEIQNLYSILTGSELEG